MTISLQECPILWKSAFLTDLTGGLGGLNLLPLSSTQAVEASHEIFLVDAALHSDCNTFGLAKLLDVTWYRCRSAEVLFVRQIFRQSRFAKATLPAGSHPASRTFAAYPEPA